MNAWGWACIRHYIYFFAQEIEQTKLCDPILKFNSFINTHFLHTRHLSFLYINKAEGRRSRIKRRAGISCDGGGVGGGGYNGGGGGISALGTICTSCLSISIWAFAINLWDFGANVGSSRSIIAFCCSRSRNIGSLCRCVARRSVYILRRLYRWLQTGQTEIPLYSKNDIISTLFYANVP